MRTSWLCSLLLVVAGQGGDATVTALLPIGTIRAELLDLTAPMPYPTLLAKFQRSAKEHGAWLSDWVKRSGPGPLPWHPNLGLTRAGHETFLALQQQLQFEPVREVTISIRRKDGWLMLDGGEELPGVSGVALNPASMVLRTPFGDCTTFTAVAPSPKQKATGPWRGHSCSRSTIGADYFDAESITFHLGRLVASGKVLLAYTAKRLRAPTSLERADVYLRYATP